MLNSQTPSGDGAEGSGATGRFCLLEGLYAYLQEIEDYRAACQRHEETVTVEEHGGELRVTRLFKRTKEALAFLTSSVHVLPCQRRQGHRAHAAPRKARHLPPHSLFRREILWGHRLLEVHARQPARGVLEVELLVPAREDDLSELPLRRLAEALRCHEFLLPASIARPLPMPPEEGRDRGIRPYLKRTMPPNLCASQWI